MVRKPAAAESACGRFAAQLAKHIAQGTRPATADGEPWTDAAFAREVTSDRSDDGYVSPRSVSNWRRGIALPVEIEGIVRALFGPSNRHEAARDALRAAFRAARLEKSERAFARAKPDPAGAHWVLDGDRLAIDRDPRPSDRRAAADPNRQQLQAVIREYAEELARRAKRLANTPTWGRMSDDASMLQVVVALAPVEVPGRLGEAYARMLRLGRYLDTDVRLQKDAMRNDEPLDPDIHGALTDLVRTAAPWLRGFPTIARLDDEAGKMLVRADLFQPARDFTRIARERNVISATDAAEIEDLAELSDDADLLGQKAGARAVGSVKNLMVAAGSVASDGAASPALVHNALATLAAAEADVEAVASTLPDDMRFALLVLIKDGQRRLKAPAAESEPYLPAPPVPDNVEEEAHDMILAGRAPPEAWRRHIRSLDFSNENLNDLRPLARLNDLHNLNIRGTLVSDLSVLFYSGGFLNASHDGIVLSLPVLLGPKNLKTLDLKETKVRDVSIISALDGLQSLDLSKTPVSDVSALKVLRGLKSLSLGGTRVKDLSALRYLSGLQSLDLSGTKVRVC